MTDFYSKLHNLMLSIVRFAKENEWENVQQLDLQRRILLEKMPKKGPRYTLTPDEASLKRSILDLDRQLLELSDNAFEHSKDELAKFNKHKSNCSQYAQTQRC